MKTRKFRRRRCTVILLINAVFVLIIFISSYHHTHRLRRLKERKLNKTFHLKKQAALLSASPPVILPDGKPDRAIILFWTTYFGGDPREDPFWILSTATYRKCFENCVFVLDKTYFGVSDAVVFHSRDMRNDEMPSIHPSNQVWVYLQQESPIYTREDLTEYKNVFNWTMTYRKDSDIYHPYFITVPLNMTGGSQNATYPKYPLTKNENIHQIFQRKTKLVAWVVSNCETKAKRENYVDQLQAFIPIDVYGSCGDFTCHRAGEHGCLPEIAYKYKFYLSFENSLCTDYITEKFSNALQQNLVPIVYGGGDYETVAPPGSFINAKDFKNPEALAEYLLLLDRNPKLYLQYFQWKTKYQVVVGDGLCSLCRKVAQQRVNPVMKSYENLSEWWHNNKRSESMCHEPPFELQNKWDFIGVLDGFKSVRRWLYKSFLGY